MTNVSFDFDTDGKPDAIGLVVDLPDLIRWVLGFEEVRSAMSTQSGIIIKVNYDGVRLVKNSNITVLSIVLLVPGGGLSSRVVNIGGVYARPSENLSAAFKRTRLACQRRKNHRKRSGRARFRRRYFGDDHWREGKCHLSMPLSQLEILQEEGLSDVPGLRYDDADADQGSNLRCTDRVASFPWLCYGLRDDVTSMPTLQKSSKTVFVSPSSVAPAGAPF